RQPLPQRTNVTADPPGPRGTRAAARAIAWSSGPYLIPPPAGPSHTEMCMIPGKVRCRRPPAGPQAGPRAEDDPGAGVLTAPRAAPADALVERAAREARLAAAPEGLIRLAETFRLHSLLAQGPGWDGSPPGVRHAFEITERGGRAFLAAVEEARQALRQVR